jgi:hypothetical protein
VDVLTLPGDRPGLRPPDEVARLCGPYFVPAPDVILPQRPVLYRIAASAARDRPERTIPATDEESAAWEAAAEACVSALLGAEREIMAAHGVRIISQGPTEIGYKVPAGRRGYPWTVRGWLARSWATARGCWNERSEAAPTAIATRVPKRTRVSAAAQRRYAEQVTAAITAYQPVAEVISGRLAEVAARIQRDQRRLAAEWAREREVAGTTSRQVHVSTHHTGYGAHLPSFWSGGWSGSIHT